MSYASGFGQGWGNRPVEENRVLSLSVRDEFSYTCCSKDPVCPVNSLCSRKVEDWNKNFNDHEAGFDSVEFASFHRIFCFNDGK